VRGRLRGVGLEPGRTRRAGRAARAALGLRNTCAAAAVDDARRMSKGLEQSGGGQGSRPCTLLHEGRSPSTCPAALAFSKSPKGARAATPAAPAPGPALPAAPARPSPPAVPARRLSPAAAPAASAEPSARPASAPLASGRAADAPLAPSADARPDCPGSACVARRYVLGSG